MLGAYALLNRNALRHNLEQVSVYAPAAKVMAVIKANAYGHGVERVANALTKADAFAVARVDEGIRLRQAGCSKAITVLEGFSSAEQLDAILHYQLDTVIHCSEQLPLLQNTSGIDRLSVWLKIDTGMNRLGFKAQEFPFVYQQLQRCALLKHPIRLMTHLANAEAENDAFTARQLGVFNTLTQGITAPRSVANSAGLMAWPAAIADWVRPGIMLYGISPFPDKTAAALGLQAVMSLHSQLIAVKPVAKGETVGYGGSWRCEENTLLGVIAMGYGDGYPRYAEQGTPVLVNGQRVPLIGRVSMDMMTVNLASQSYAKVGDPVTLWGEGLAVEDIAACSGTIPYTLVCGVTQRVRRLEIA
jgi:alanine racemase